MDEIASDYALLSLAAYRDKRNEKNRIYPSSEWHALPGVSGHAADVSGFEAIAYRNIQSNEIVIAYTGTDELSDWWTNLGGFTGAWPSVQMKSAAKFYAEVSAANPKAKVTFTGHSLGGGLAGLMGVLFNRPAYTFDPAPFRASAHNDTRRTIRQYLADNSLLNASLAEALDSFSSTLPASDVSAPPPHFVRGEDAIQRFVTQNEALAKWLPDNFIGNRAPTFLDHASLDQSSVDLHSMSLEAALIIAPGFWDAARRLNNLIPVLFDTQLFSKDATQATPTLLDHLLRNQIGVTGPNVVDATDPVKRNMLTHFAVDLAKIVSAGGQVVSDNDLNRALIAFAGRAYLKQSSGFENELFERFDGGVGFDTGKISSDISADPGYVRHIEKFFERQLGNEGYAALKDRILQSSEWYLAGTGLVAKAKGNAAFMLGSEIGDNLSGGTVADLLIGMAGNDILIGGTGSDILNGGQGYDSYAWNTTDGDDVVIDSDKKGRLLINGSGINVLLKQSATTWTTADGKVTLTQGDTWKLSIESGGSIDLGASFSDGDYGLHRLEGAPTIAPTLKGDLKPILDGNGRLQYVGDNVLVDASTAETNRADSLYGDGGAGRIQGMGGNDFLFARSGNDIVEGGIGSDVLSGQGDNDILFGDSLITLADAWSRNDLTNGQATRGDWLDGDTGDDILVGDVAKDILTGGQGSDLVLGGAGDDLLLGDATFLGTITESWGATRTESTADNRTTYTYSIQGVSAMDEGETVGADDALYGGSGSDWLFGKAGDDLLDGGVGTDKDVLFGGAGNDILIGRGGNDVLVGDDPNLPDAWHGDDWLDGGDGVDTIEGGAGNDVIIGGKENDSIIGGAGRDTYIFNRGDGVDSIIDDDSGPDKSILVFGEGFDKNSIKLKKGSLMLDLGDGDAIHIENFDAENPLASPTFSSFQFADGSSLTWEEMLDKGFDLDGTDLDDEIVGTGVADRIDGRAGNDTIWGLAGDDVLIGGAGTDYIDGGLGDDSYIVRAGEAPGDFEHGLIETIVDGGGKDTLVLEGVAPALIQAAAGAPNELRISLGGTDQLAIVGGIGGTVENFSVGNETLTTAEFIGRHAEAALSGINADGRALLLGGQRDDILIAPDGHATFSGGRGNDVLLGSGGNDIYLYSLGDGTDSLTDASSKTDTQLNTLKVGAGITADDLHIRAGEPGVLILQIGADPNDAIHIQGFDPAAVTGAIDLIEFNDGSTLSYADLLTRGREVQGSIGDDTLTASILHDRLIGGGGNDTYRLVTASDAGDEIIEAENEGIDTVESAIDYTLAPHLENLTLIGTAIRGSGNGLDNLIAGNALDNTLAGGEGIDSYRFARQSGDDLVLDAGANLIELGIGLAFDDIAATRDGDDLLLSIRRDSGTLRVQGYFTDGTAWQVVDGDGAQRDSETLLADTAVFEEDRIATLARDFLAATRQGLEQNLSTQGHARQADGSWVRVTQSADDLQVTHTDQATTTTYTGRFSTGVVAWTSDGGTEHTHSWSAPGAAYRYAVTTRIVLAQVSADEAEIYAQAGDYQSSGDWRWAEVSWGAPQAGVTTHGSDLSVQSWTIYGGPGTLETAHSYDSVTTHYQGTLTGRFLPGPGTGNLPVAVAIQASTESLTYLLQEIDLMAGDHVVYANGLTAVIGGVGDNSIYNAGFAYGGTGNGRLIGGNVLIAGKGDQWLEGGATMVVGDGRDTVVAGVGQVVRVGRDNSGSDLVLGQGVDAMAVVDAWYQRQGIDDWQESYDYAGYYSLHHGDIGSGKFESLADLESYLAPYEWANVTDLFNQGAITVVAPLPFLVQVQGQTEPGPYYAQNPVPVVTLGAQDFAGLQPFYESGLLGSPTVEFGEGIALADLTFSWGEVVSPLDGLRHVTLDIGWGPGQGIRVLAPRSGDPLGASVNDFRFANDDRVSLPELFALAPPAPDFDPFDAVEILGTDGDDLMDGTAGDDTLSGLGGNDTLAAGAGDDVVDGGAGDDSYLFAAGDGADVIVDAGGVDQLAFATGISSARVTAIRTDARVTINVSATDRVSFDVTGPGQYAVESVVFRDGAWQAADIRRRVNFAPSGEVGVGGTASQGQSLIASSTLADADGLGGIAYVWQSSADGAHWADIAGATDGSLALAEAQVGRRLRVVASYTDGQGNDESVASEPTVVVANINDAPGGTLAIGGVARQGQILIAGNTLVDADGLGPMGYQWKSSTDGVTWNTIVGTTSDSLTLGEALVGQVVRVTVRYIDGHGSFESVESAATAVVANLNDDPGGEVGVVGTATQGRSLMATNNLADVDGIGAIGYRWQSSGDGMAWADIADATGENFTLTEAQVGLRVRAVAGYTDGHGTAETVASAATAAVANQNDLPTGTVAIDGMAIEGQTLAATNDLADPDGMGEVGYQWQISADYGSTWTNIADATGNSLALTEAEIGKRLRVVASYTDGHGTPESRTSAAGALVAPMPGRVRGTEFGEALHGSAQLDDMISGYGGADHLFGLGGNDTLIGGADDDFLLGGPGGDTYLFGLGDGHDWIFENVDYPPRADEVDVLRFGAGIAPTDVRAASSYTDLILTISGTGESVYLTNWRNPAYAHVSRIEFDGGTAWNEEALAVIAAKIDGTEGDDDLEIGTFLADKISGFAGNDFLGGAAGNDTLDGGVGDDFLAGGPGSDIYLFDRGDGHDFINSWDEGDGAPDVIRFAAGIAPRDVRVRSGEADSLVLTIADTGDSQTVWLWHTPGARRVTRVEFADDTVWDESALETFAARIEGGAGNDYLWGTNRPDVLSGLMGNDTLSGQGGDDVLDGGPGDDYLIGGAGEDTYIFRRGDGQDRILDADGSDQLAFAGGISMSEVTASREGKLVTLRLSATDSVSFDETAPGVYAVNSIEFADGTWLAADLRLRLNAAPTGEVGVGGTALVGQTLVAGSTLADADGLGAISYQWQSSGDGSTWNDIVGATAASFTLGEAQGGKQLRVSASYIDGRGTLETVVSAATPAVLVAINHAPTLAAPIADQFVIEESAFTFTVPVGTFADVDIGDALGYQASRSDGSALPPWLAFDAATRTFSGTPPAAPVAQLAVRVTATDRDGASISDTFTLDVANRVVGTEAANALFGTSQRDVIDGQAGNDTLDGGTGADVLVGGVGDDTYRVDRGDDRVVEAPGEGLDQVLASASFVLPDGVENLTLNGWQDADGTGNALDNVIIGNGDANRLLGLDGDDWLDGGPGHDSLSGGAGDDTYVVDQAGDGIVELPGEGFDRVRSSVSWTLGANLEQLQLLGSAPLSGIGNAADNRIYGNDGSNMLDGGAGADTLVGGRGNDVYVVDHAGDVIIEAPDEGADTARSSAVSVFLADNVENLVLTGSASIDGTGNAQDNLLIGNAGSNRLSGGEGNDSLDGGGASADTLVGGSGNDVYTVYGATQVIELAGQGTDTVRTPTSYTLTANVENLILEGGSGVAGHGNELDNILTGNSGNNALSGHAGNDTLDGQSGTDLLIGGSGSDTYLLGRGHGADTVREDDATVGNLDSVHFLAGIAADQIWLRHVGNHLQASVIGTGDSLTIENWYSGSQYRVEQFRTADGKALLDGQVESLVQAMAAFAPPSPGQTSLPGNYQEALAPVIAANWQ